MRETTNAPFTSEELEAQHTAELPGRDLLLGVSLLFIPIASISGLNVDISGPDFLF